MDMFIIQMRNDAPLDVGEQEGGGNCCGLCPGHTMPYSAHSYSPFPASAAN